ncbi:adaptin N terminal region-domain-containing protein [Haematococcus lacustris]
MSIRLRDLIRAVRSCKTAAEEREVIAKESAALREAFRDQDASESRHRNVAKLMYIHMLGHPTHFGQMETMKLIATTGFGEKRIGYLGVMILLDERQEVLMLVTNSVKMDMNNSNPYIAGLAMAALGNICSAEMARDLAPDVERIIESGSPYLRKKAALCAVRILKKAPDLLEGFVNPAARLLKAADGAVQLAGVSLMLQVTELEPATALPAYRQHVPALCQLLRRLLQPGGVTVDNDVSGIANPFLQVKILRLLRHLGHGDADASDQMSDTLAQVASNIDASRNAGNAVLYECVQTIMGVESIAGLRLLAINTLGKFLANRDNNMRYVALNTLAKVVAVDTQAVQRHRTTIVECVKDADVSIRRRALELVYGLVNEGNIKTLTRELLDYLAVSDAEFKPDLTAKICTLIQRFAPDKRWHLDNLLQVMTQAGAHVKEEVCRALIVLITNAPELHAYSARAMYRNLHAYQDVAHTSLLITGLWCIGEFGEMLLPGAGGPLLEGEPVCNASEKDVVDLLAVILLRKASEAIVREYALTAVMKLTARLPGQLQRLQTLIGRHTRSAALESQSRCAEYGRMFKLSASVRAQLLERMPALDEAAYVSNLGAELRPAAPAAAAAPPALPSYAGRTNGLAAANGVQATARDLLGDLDSIPVASPIAALGASVAGAAAPPPPQPVVTAAAASDLLDLLGDPTPVPMPAAPAAAAPPPPPAVVSPRAAAPVGVVVGSSLVHSSPSGLTIHFTYSKPTGLGSELTEINATYSTSGTLRLTDFSLQAAVPKYIQLKLEPASGTIVAPGAGGEVRQRIYLKNGQQGVKPLAIRLRIGYTPESSAPVQEAAELSSFPSGC